MKLLQEQRGWMRAQTTADQKEMVKARTARPHPVPGRIERDAHTACEGKAVAAIMALDETDKRASELG